MMTARPILFSGPMVRAILEGRKTQTRRVVKGLALEWLQPGMFTPEFVADPVNNLCPQGRPDDLLWVREACRAVETDSAYGVGYKASPGHLKTCHDTPEWNRLMYYGGNGRTVDRNRWVPSIHMPRWASRLTLRITEVRAERLQEISEADAIAEGLKRLSKDGGKTWKHGIPDLDGLPGRDDLGWEWADWNTDPRLAFRKLWNSLNASPKPRYGRVDGKRVITHYESFPWEEGTRTEEYRGKPHYIHGNPWVWPIGFEPIPTNVDEVLK